MPSGLPKDATRLRVRGLAAGLVPDRTPAVHTQIERVFVRITSDEQRDQVRAPADLAAAFRSKGLIPPLLVGAQRGMAAGNPEGAAVAFAAAIYPQRAYQMPETVLGLRVRAFEESLDDARLKPRAPSAPSPPHGIVDDLAGLDGLAPDSSPDEREAWQRGATLYLSTCYPELLERMRANWATEAATVRFVRRCLPSPPSTFAREDGSRPNWSRVAAELARAFPEAPAGARDAAVILEQMALKEARKWSPSETLGHAVAGYWESVWDKLVSGFPYYAFASRFTYWWRQCLENYRFSPDRTVPLDERHETRAAVVDAPVADLSADQLRIFREGYRLVRTTFFRRADKAAGGELRLDAARHNERLRSALDALWYERLEQRISDDLPPEMVREIAARFPELGATTINNLSFRLRLRTWAFSLGRLMRLRNAQILSARRPGDDRPAEQPATEPGMLTVASVARLVSPGHTLLWAFAAHVFMHPRLVPQRPDPWTFHRFVRELWHWVCDPAFDEVLRRGAEEGRRADRAALDALASGPLADLVRDLRAQPDVDHVERWLASRTFDAESVEARRHVAAVIGASGLRAADDAALRAWRARADPVWIVPTWYLTFVEGVRVEDIPSRLCAERDDHARVTALARAMAASPELAAEARRRS